MPIDRHAGNPGRAGIVSADTMLRAIRDAGIIPFFSNPIRGCSIEEMTPPEFWFDGESDTLGPWDWKVDCVQSGDIAYGKFLWGGKAAFATPEMYRELMNYRRSLSRYRPGEEERKVLDLLAERGSLSSKDIRNLLGVRKAGADKVVTRLQMQCRLVTGDITRVYRGPDLHYNGWQIASFCAPEALFGSIALVASGISGDTSFWPAAPSVDTGHNFGPGGFPFADEDDEPVSHSPEESYRILSDRIREIAPAATDSQIAKMLG